MTTAAQAGRAAAAAELQAIAAEWRGRSMPDDAQARFDARARDIEAFDAEIAAETAAEQAAEAERRRAGPERPPLAAKFRGLREVNDAADRATAAADIQELAATYRGYGMPDDAQHAFDMLVLSIDAYDAECAERAANPPPPDSRDGILAGMRERAGYAPPPQPSATPDYWDLVRQQGRAFRRSRLN